MSTTDRDGPPARGTEDDPMIISDSGDESPESGRSVSRTAPPNRTRRDDAGDDVSELADALDDLPALLNSDSGGSDPFPGAGCVTVAKAGSMYLNRYGPPRTPWFVLSVTCILEDDQTEKDLIDISDEFQRVLDHPVSKRDPEKDQKKFKAADIRGLLGLVWDFPEDATPQEAVERLNPAVVKKTNQIPNKKAREKHTREHGRLPAYPTTYVWLKFSRSINHLIDGGKSDAEKIYTEETFNGWNVCGAYKQCYRNKDFGKEREIYLYAQRQMDRFLEWYDRPERAAQRARSVLNPSVRYATADRRSPTMDPRTIQNSIETPEGAANSPTEDLRIKTEAPSTEIERSAVSAPRPPTQPATLEQPPPSSEQDELTREEMETAYLYAFKMQARIAPTQELTETQRRQFNIVLRQLLPAI